MEDVVGSDALPYNKRMTARLDQWRRKAEKGRPANS
jgi:hypothetical protein